MDSTPYLTSQSISRLEWRMAVLEDQFQKLKESTTKEISSLRQLIKVTWRSLIDERKSWQKDADKTNKAIPKESFHLQEIKEVLISENVKVLSLFPGVQDDIQSLMQRVSYCETQIGDCFNRFQRIDLDFDSNRKQLKLIECLPNLEHKMTSIMRKLVLCETQIEKSFSLLNHFEQPKILNVPILNHKLRDSSTLNTQEKEGISTAGEISNNNTCCCKSTSKYV